jgi:pimeloyl-ACP methyl ester carboxylesterase
MILIAGTVERPHQIMFDGRWMEYIFPITESIFERYPRIFEFLWKVLPRVPLIQLGIMHGGFNPTQVEQSFVNNYLKKITHLSPRLFFSLMENMYHDSIRSHLPKMMIPTLLVAGDADKIIPLHTQYHLLQQLSHAELYIVKDGSHVPQVDFPQQVNERMYSFLKKIASYIPKDQSP